MFILRAIDLHGNKFFYTGRAGAGWVNADVNEAFVYNTKEGAMRKAEQHNEWTALHGLAWSVVTTPDVLAAITRR